MISFALDEEQEIIRSTLQEFGLDVLRPVARKADDSSSIEESLLGALWDIGVIQSQFRDDGEDGSSVTNAIILEELGAADAAMAVAVAAPMGFVKALASHGSAGQRQLLERFTGNTFEAGAIAVSDAGFASDVQRPSTKAMRSGDDFTLNGVKTMVPLGSRCSHFLATADSGGALDAFIVPAQTAGVKVTASTGTLGLRAAQLATVAFENVRVPASMRLGEGNGADIQRIIDSARIGLTAIMTGLSRAVMEYVIPYTKSRIVHGTELAKKQTMAFNIADMHISIEAMRWMTWKAAWELQANRSAMRSAQLAYTYGGKHAMTIADQGLQALGGHGYVTDHPVEMWYRNARSLSVLEGAVGV
jgi:alkylation response protein AidB-like acyl-CoA dehydrogenase